MAKTSSRRVKTLESHVESPTDDILHFSLQNLLPTDQLLAMDKNSGILVRFSCGPHSARMLVVQQFTTSEVCVLLPLLRAYPHYSPCEILLASFNNMDVNDVSIAQCRQRLRKASQAGKGAWSELMRPVQNALSRTRLKLQLMGIDVVSIFETGYLVIPYVDPSEQELKDA